MRLRRFLSLSIAIVFLFNGVGYFVFMLIKLEQAKYESEVKIKLKLPFNILTSINIPTSNEALCHEAREGEFSLNGEMYDVARMEITDDTLYCYCLNDQAETKLTQNLNMDEQIKSKGKQIQVQNTQTLVKNEQRTNYLSNKKIILKSFVLAHPAFRTENQLVPFSGFHQIDTPPPRRA